MVPLILNPINIFNSAIDENGDFSVGNYSATAVSPLGSSISAFSMEDDDDLEMVESQPPLTLGIRYQDFAQKYEPILAMCESFKATPCKFFTTNDSQMTGSFLCFH